MADDNELPDMWPMGWLTETEHAALDVCADLANRCWSVVVAGAHGHINDPQTSNNMTNDQNELVFHIHAIQQAIMSNAAARAYPDKFRLLGGRIHRD